MKCPQCGTKYTDESLRFCLADGAELVREADPFRIDIPQQDVRFSTGPDQQPRAPRIWLFVVLGTVTLGLIALTSVAVLAIMFYIGNAEAESEAEIFPTPAISESPANDLSDDARIKQELEKLEQKLAEMEEPPITGDPFPDDLKEAAGFPIDATVNSPNDGFLALRSVPSTEIGDRIAAIPHGTKVQVIVCDQTYHMIGGNRGRWCLLMWGENAGWAFDAWLAF